MWSEGELCLHNRWIVHVLTIVLSFQPGDFVHTLGDAHVYMNHIDPLKLQVKDSLHKYYAKDTHLCIITNTRQSNVYSWWSQLRIFKGHIWEQLTLFAHSLKLEITHQRATVKSTKMLDQVVIVYISIILNIISSSCWDTAYIIRGADSKTSAVG